MMLEQMCLREGFNCVLEGICRHDATGANALFAGVSVQVCFSLHPNKPQASVKRANRGSLKRAQTHPFSLANGSQSKQNRKKRCRCWNSPPKVVFINEFSSPDSAHQDNLRDSGNSVRAPESITTRGVLCDHCCCTPRKPAHGAKERQRHSPEGPDPYGG